MALYGFGFDCTFNPIFSLFVVDIVFISTKFYYPETEHRMCFI